MRRWFSRLVRRIVVTVLIVFAVLFGVRVYEIEGGPPLQPWHTYVPNEPTRAEMDRDDWAAYLAAEASLFEGVRSHVTDKLDPAEQIPSNRYFEGSPLYPPRFAQDWNRSFELKLDGPVLGAAVFLHGLTDAPYSLRHIAETYRQRGFVAVGIRLPGHGTVPGGLTQVDWQDWMAATRLAVREARKAAPAGTPLHMVGYSNGGALALMYALDAIDEPSLARPDRIVLFSPMVGVTRFARFAGLAGLPALLPAFAKASWLSILPEFNPFKYNSFPVNAARQSFLLSDTLQQRLARMASEGRLAALAPVLTFQSVVDQTVSTPAILSALYDQLPANGSKIVLFDINRSSTVAPLFTAATGRELGRLLPVPPRRYEVTVLADAAPGRTDVVERVTPAGASAETVSPTGLVYPADVYSLSHIAIPFPITDGLYGTDPDPADNFGIHLGDMVARGERGTLIIDQDTLMRMSSNPFYPYMIDQIERNIAAPAAATPAPVTPPAAPAAAPSTDFIEPEPNAEGP